MSFESIEEARRLRRKIRHRETERLRYLRKREQIREYQRLYRLEHLEEYKARDKRYTSKPEVRVKRLAHMKKWHQENSIKPENKIKKQIAGRAHYQKNKAEISKKHREWRKKNPALNAFFRMKRRALEKKASINLKAMKEWIKAVRSKPSAICYYCTSKFPISEIHFDHIIPLSKGGDHSVENLCISCKSCNLTKGRKTTDAWIRVGQQVLSL